MLYRTSFHNSWRAGVANPALVYSSAIRGLCRCAVLFSLEGLPRSPFDFNGVKCALQILKKGKCSFFVWYTMFTAQWCLWCHPVLLWEPLRTNGTSCVNGDYSQIGTASWIAQAWTRPKSFNPKLDACLLLKILLAPGLDRLIPDFPFNLATTGVTTWRERDKCF